MSLGSWARVLLLFFTVGTTCEVGALYFKFTGASGFLAAAPEDELKSRLKLEMKRERGEERARGRERERRGIERKRDTYRQTARDADTRHSSSSSS